MGIEIQGANADSDLRKVRIEHDDRLKTSAVSKPVERLINEDDQKYWTIPFDAINPTGADDYFLYITNTGNNNIHVTDVRVSSDVAGILEVQHVTVAAVGAVGGSAVTAVNRTLGNANAPAATIESGVDITNLTDAGVLFFLTLVADIDRELKSSGHIIIPKGQTVALLWTVATGVLTGSVSIFENSAS